MPQAIGGVAQAGAGIASAAMMAKAQKKIAKWNIASQERIHEASAADREKYSQMVQAESQIAQKNLLASEQARSTVMSMLGQPGTYGPSGASGRACLPWPDGRDSRRLARRVGLG